MSPTSTGPALSRIAVWYSGTQKDLVLPSASPISDYIADVVDALGDDHPIAAPPASEWTLALPTGALKPDRSLLDCRVTDGTALELRAVRSTERYRPVIEDVIDAVADAASSAGRPFDESAARLAGLVGLSVGGVSLCIGQWRGWAASGHAWWWLVIGLVGAVIAFVGTWSAARRYEANDAATAWAVVFVSASAVVGQAIPVSQRTGSLGMAHVMVSAVAVGAAAIGVLLITRRHLAIVSAVVSIAATVAVISAVGQYTELQPSAIAAGVLIAGLIGLQMGPRTAASLARIALPKVPAENEPIEVGGEISDQELATVRLRSQRAVQMTTGFVVAAALIVALATVWTVDPASYHWIVELVIAVCVVVVLITWGRTLSNGVQAFSLLAAATIVILGSSARLLGAWPTGWKPAIVIGVVAVAMTVLVIVAVVVTPRGVNPRIKRLVEILGVMALVAAYPLAAWVTGIFGVLRDLAIG